MLKLKKLLFIFLIIVLLGTNYPQVVNAAPALVQFKRGPSTSGPTTISAAFDSNVTAGNLIVVSVMDDNGGTISSVTDSRGNTYQQATTTVWIGTGRRTWVYYAYNVAAGATNVTTTFAGAGQANMLIHEFSGILTTDPLDGKAATKSADSGTSLPVSANFTTTVDGDLIFAHFNTAGYQSIIPGGGLVEIDDFDGNSRGMETSYRTAGTAGTYNVTGTMAGNAWWAATGVSFKPTGGAPPPPPAVPGVSRLDIKGQLDIKGAVDIR